MARRRATKTVKFTLEFDKPNRAQILAVACPFCQAEIGRRCTATGWYDRRDRAEISTLHHDRIAKALGLEIVIKSTTYRLKS